MGREHDYDAWRLAGPDAFFGTLTEDDEEDAMSGATVFTVPTLTEGVLRELPGFLEKLKGATEDTAAIHRLTPREMLIFWLTVRYDMSAAEIAAALGNSVRTIDSHRANLGRKLQPAGNLTIAGMVHYAYALGWLPQGSLTEFRCRALSFARLFKAYLELTDSHQVALRRVIEIVNDEQADLDERERALDAIVDALSPHTFPFPGNSHDHNRSVHLQGEMDNEEATFAARLKALLAMKKVTQIELAKRIGVRQSAVSMMVNRSSRPQRSTVEKIARALVVAPEYLWPTDTGKEKEAV
jgi:DNA-binding Xre family transcriptional regulator